MLTHIAAAYRNASLLWEKLFPLVRVGKEGVKVPTFGKGRLALYETKRAVGADSNILLREKQAELMFNEEIKAIKQATDGILLRREQYVAELAQ
ncbi:phage protein|nr:phage protein [Candidatus Pantoea persica]